MDPVVVLFLRASLVWLVAGVTLGVGMAVRPAMVTYRTAHIHMLLLGFVAGMIFGVGYHVFPRFAGHPLWSRRLVRLHWWLANAGVAVMAAAFALRAGGVTWSHALLGAGGTSAALGAYLFAWNIWRTLGGSTTRQVVTTGAARAPLPIVPD
jgi:cbb3-type cytochrome oxidase subunit 1